MEVRPVLGRTFKCFSLFSDQLLCSAFVLLSRYHWDLVVFSTRDGKQDEKHNAIDGCGTPLLRLTLILFLARLEGHIKANTLFTHQ